MPEPSNKRDVGSGTAAKLRLPGSSSTRPELKFPMLKPVNDVFTPLNVPTFSPNAEHRTTQKPTDGSDGEQDFEFPFANPGNAWDSPLISALDCQPKYHRLYSRPRQSHRLSPRAKRR